MTNLREKNNMWQTFFVFVENNSFQSDQYMPLFLASKLYEPQFWAV